MTTNRKYHLKSEFAVSNLDDLIQFYSICQMLANFSGVKSERTLSKFRKRLGTFTRCAHLLRKEGA